METDCHVPCASTSYEGGGKRRERREERGRERREGELDERMSR
jgi:hypothetical protein